jgi:hypothetical protein
MRSQLFDLTVWRLLEKEVLNSDGQQFLQYQRNEQSPQLIEHESRKIDDISTDLISVNIFYCPKT